MPGGGATAPEVVLIHLAGRTALAYGAPYESQRLGVLAASLRAAGLTAELVDSALDPGGHAACMDAVRRAKRLIVVDAMYRTAGDALALARRAHSEAVARIVLVGDAAAGSAREILVDEPTVGAIVTGDPEQVVPALATTRDWSAGVPGAVVRGSAGVVAVTGIAADVAALPWADRAYLETALRARPVADVASSRGCSSRCSFCIIGSGTDGRGDGAVRRWRARPARDVAAEIAALVTSHGVRRVHFTDDNLVGARHSGRRRAFELARLLSPLAIAFSCYVRADALDGELVAALADAGLRQVHLGIELGTQLGLDRLRKDQSLEAAGTAVRLLRECDVRVVPSLIAFEQRQTLAELRDSLSWIADHGLEEGFGPGGLLVLPGTRTTAELRMAGLVDGAERSWRSPSAQVRFSDPAVAAVARAVVRFERALDARRDGEFERLARGYHRFNDDLEAADPHSPLRGVLEAHRELRAFELRRALELAGDLAGDSAASRCAQGSDWIARWPARDDTHARVTYA